MMASWAILFKASNKAWPRGHEADKRIHGHILLTAALGVQEADFSNSRRELIETDVLDNSRHTPLCLKIPLNISSLTRCDYMCVASLGVISKHIGCPKKEYMLQ